MMDGRAFAPPPAAARRMRWGILLICTFCFGYAATAGNESPEAWLDRMISASGQINYRGTMVHMCGGKVDVVSVVHRVEGGRVTERMRAMDNGGRQIIRSPGEVMCIMPDAGTVIVGPQHAQLHGGSTSVAPAPNFANINHVNYRIQLQGTENVAGHATEIIAIRPTDDYRFGYRLWLHRGNAVPLQYALIAPDGRTLERTLFTEIRFMDRLPESDVAPGVATSNFVWQRADSGGAANGGLGVVVDPARSAWTATEVPPGFRLVSSESLAGFDDGSGVEHLVYSDGLASVSVFVESDVDRAEMQPGVSELGASNAYTTVRGSYLVTAVGGVPVRTVRMLALSAQPQDEQD